jgi:NTP-dependent ternary system trypsin peptidase co-occuring protein
LRRLVQFPLENGESIVVEVDEVETQGGVVRATRPGEIAVKATETFESALETIKPAAGTIIAKLRSLLEPPDKIDVEFGIKLSADAKAYIASAGVEANYKVTLTWNAVNSSKV